MSRLRYGALLALALTAGGPTGHAATPAISDLELAQMLNRAVEQLKQGDRDGAVVKLEAIRDAAARQPDYTFMVGVVAKIYADMGMDERAIQTYQQAIALRPTNAVYHADLATVYARTGRIDQALIEAERSVELDPHDPFNLHTLAKCSLQIGKVQQAKERLSRTVTLARASGEAAEAAAADQEVRLIAALERVPLTQMAQAVEQVRQEYESRLAAARAQGDAAAVGQMEQQLQFLTMVEQVWAQADAAANATPPPTTHVLHLNNGNDLEGLIVSSNAREVTVEIPGVGTLAFARTEIASIEERSAPNTPVAPTAVADPGVP